MTRSNPCRRTGLEIGDTAAPGKPRYERCQRFQKHPFAGNRPRALRNPANPVHLAFFVFFALFCGDFSFPSFSPSETENLTATAPANPSTRPESRNVRLIAAPHSSGLDLNCQTIKHGSARFSGEPAAQCEPKVKISDCGGPVYRGRIDALYSTANWLCFCSSLSYALFAHAGRPRATITALFWAEPQIITQKWLTDAIF